ncbi:MAG: hypothetical protein E2O39_08295 [Planctomycetota bacterium]|nr:MAG: hypothetical protein E2O39_08295 [Planctomycetota bacterium]
MNDPLRILALLAAASMVTACPAGPVEPRSTGFEVLVLATIHAPWQFRDPRIAPPFSAAALAASDPGVVGLETDEEWLAQEKFHDVTFEASHIALPFVKARGIMAYGVEPLDIPAWKHRAEMYARRFEAKVQDQLARGVLPVEEYGAVPVDEMEQAEALFRAQRKTFERVIPLLEELCRSRRLATERCLTADDGELHAVSRLFGWKPLTLAREFPRTLLAPLEPSKIRDVPD